MNDHCIGAMIADSQGTIVHSSGVARSPDVQQWLRTQLGLLTGDDGKIVRGLPLNGLWHPVRIHRCGDTEIALVFPVEAKRIARAAVERSNALDRIIGSSSAIESLKEEVRRIASKDVTVLLIGESGTGKELVARSIHELSKRHAAPYVAVNAAALPASLFESEFFGYATGAFTGADRRGKRGRLEQAHTGTLFLDEIGDMPIEVQVKLLRVLQDGQFERLGSATPTHSDFRLISATHRDIGEMVRSNQFRLDMFYRIGAVTLRLPPLRERLADIPCLAEAFLAEFSAKHGAPRIVLRADANHYLMSQSWPGNVRQLRHVVEKAAIFADDCEVGVDDLRLAEAGQVSIAETSVLTRHNSTVRHAIQEVEISMIREALNRYDGNKRRTAAALGISRGYLYKRLSEAGARAEDDAVCEGRKGATRLRPTSLLTAESVPEVRHFSAG